MSPDATAAADEGVVTAAAPAVVRPGLRPGTGSSSVRDLARAAGRHLFFTGKGGVGKTSVASAVAVLLADEGLRVLIVSTDPASNLDEVLQVDAGAARTPVSVPGVAGLSVLNIDPVAAAATYREKVVGPYRGVLPEFAVRQIEEGLSGACTVEVAAFNEFIALLADPTVTAGFDRVVFDTAPTGHTLRLLNLPAAWSQFLADTDTVTCIGPAAQMGRARQDYLDALDVLRDPEQTTVVLVARPETSTLHEADRAGRELAALGLAHQRLVVNAVLPTAGQNAGPDAAPDEPSDEVADAWRARGTAALAELPEHLAGLADRVEVPLSAVAPLGVDALRRLGASSVTSPPDAAGQGGPDDAVSATIPLSALVDRLVAQGPGLVMTMGKGGVGKTTLAAALAVALAERGHRVTLTTTDPAAHVDSVLPDPSPLLHVTRIDPAAETAEHTARVLAGSAETLDAAALALLQEDLASPCTEEVAVFLAFARTVAEAAHEYVVIDTAPTGHTLLLLDAAGSFSRQALAQSGTADAQVTGLLTALRDPTAARILLVALPEATPVHEALGLQADLRRAGIEPAAWIVNSALSATATRDPLLIARARRENRWIDEIAAQGAGTPVVVPWQCESPVGTAALSRLTR